jgi:hypothetical protein
MQYRFSSLKSLADYLNNRATMFRESADGVKSNQKRALFIERAVTHESIADMIRQTVIEPGETDATIYINPQREK